MLHLGAIGYASLRKKIQLCGIIIKFLSFYLSAMISKSKIWMPFTVTGNIRAIDINLTWIKPNQAQWHRVYTLYFSLLLLIESNNSYGALICLFHIRILYCILNTIQVIQKMLSIMSHNCYKQIQKSYIWKNYLWKSMWKHDQSHTPSSHTWLYRLCQWATVRLHICHSMFKKPELALHISPSQSQCALTIVMLISKILEHIKSHYMKMFHFRTTSHRWLLRTIINLYIYIAIFIFPLVWWS